MIQLKDLCQKASSNIAQKDLEGHEGQYPIYGASGLIGYVDFYKQENPYVAVVKDGAGIGRVMCLPEKSSVIGTMQYILPNEGVNVHYLAFAMEHMNLAKYFSGATIPHIYFKDYGKEKLLERTEKEQKSIAEILSKMDSLISLRKQQIVKLDELVKARFVEMFGSYPENENAYPVVNVSDIADAGVGVVIKPAQYYVTEECGIKAFRSLNIGEMYIKDSDWVYFSAEGNESNKKSQLHENDLLIVRSGAPGTSCVVTKEFEGCNAVDVIIAHPDLSKVNPWYLCAYINYPHGKKQIEEGTGGAAQQHFNVGKCNNLKVLLPPLKAQNQFADFVERVSQQKQTVQQSLEKLELMKKALMQEYFG